MTVEDKKILNSARFMLRSDMRIIFRHSGLERFEDEQLALTTMKALPEAMAKLVQEYKRAHRQHDVGYLMGPLGGVIEAQMGALDILARDIENREEHMVLTIGDFFSVSWATRLRDMAPKDSRYARLYDEFLAMKVDNHFTITRIYVRKGWETIPCVPDLVRCAVERGQVLRTVD